MPRWAALCDCVLGRVSPRYYVVLVLFCSAWAKRIARAATVSLSPGGLCISYVPFLLVLFCEHHKGALRCTRFVLRSTMLYHGACVVPLVYFFVHSSLVHGVVLLVYYCGLPRTSQGRPLYHCVLISITMCYVATMGP